MRPRPTLRLRLARVALAQIVLGGARGRSRRSLVRIELLLGDGNDAAVLAHLEHIEALRRICEHPMLAGELGCDPLDGALHSERLAAADAVERLLLLEEPRAGSCSAEIELRMQGDHLLRTGRLA